MTGFPRPRPRRSRSSFSAILALVMALGAGLGFAGRAAAQDEGCAGLARAGAFPHTTVSRAVAVPADAAHAAPAYCEVTGVLASEPGSHIGVVYRLPAGWNGKFVGFGGGAWGGNVRLETALAALRQGYATGQTDGGHPNPGGETSWIARDGKLDQVALRDFSYAAVHEMTVLGKAVVVQYYARPQSVAIFQGCSTGGRMALMEAQRFPDDYDGITAGAPVYTLRVQAEQIWRDVIFAQPGAALSADDVKLVQAASLAACDDLDGLKDGVVTNPALCRFDPAVLQCKAGATTGCLTGAQVAAVRKAYADVRVGREVVSFGLSRGGEAGWPLVANTRGDPSRLNAHYGMRWPIFGSPDFSYATFDPARDMPKARQGAFAKEYEATDPDLSPFVRHGGKLLIWHGMDDPGPSYRGTIEYYDAVQGTTGPKVTPARLDGAVRLFLLPGVYHCGGGPGADRFDPLAAIDSWIQTGRAPDRLAAAKADGSMPRPLCPYPALPRYDGRGDARDERSFVCRAGK